MLRRMMMVAMVLLMLPMGAAGVGAIVVTEVQGSGQISGGSGQQAALPAAWRTATALAAGACPGEGQVVMESLGWLATGAGRRVGSTPPPWSSVPAGPFGIDPMWSTRRFHSLLSAAEDASTIVCRAIVAGGGLEGALLMLTGSAPLALDVEIVGQAILSDPLISETRLSAVAFASTAIGLPYQWGGNGPDTYDCSGLMVAAFRAGGLALPRTAQEQHDVTTVETTGVGGDMVFFGSGPEAVEHVGIIIGGGLMIDAPHTGAVVRIESYQWDDLVSIGRASGS